MTEASTSNQAADLRWRAEDKAKRDETEIQETLSPEDARDLIHELHVHQIELEMQNEELRRTQVELETSRARYFDLYDLAPVGYFTFSEQGLILEANLTVATLLGVARGDLIKQPISRFVFPEDQDILYRHRRQLFATGAPQVYEVRLARKDGAHFWARLEATTDQDADGAPMGRTVVSDITERNRAEEERRHFTETLEKRVAERTRELKAANASLEQSAAQLRKLAVELTQVEERERKRLATILHDHLQQILVAAKIKIGLLCVLDEDQAQAILQVLDLLRDAIDASRSLAVDLHPPVLLDGGLMPGLHWLVRWAKEEHGLEVEVTGKDTPDVPEPLSILLFQTVRELLLNVVKHAGVDRASVDMDQPGAGSLRVVVNDHGIGFPQNSSAEGFGLFHLRERISYIGGTLDVASAPGRGARVSVTVPFQPCSKSPLISAIPNDALIEAPLREARPDTYHLLVVDDHTLVRQGLVEMLSKETDIAVIGVAANGEEAIQLARSLRPDIVLMDISMPGINGIDATRIIRAEMPEVRVIGLSMHEDVEMRCKMQEAGAKACYHKGGPVEELVEAIRAVTRSRS